MSRPQFHLAQINVADMLYPIEHEGMAEFVARLDAVNALADGAPGFVWRLQDTAGDATAIRAFVDNQILINMSVWESVEALFDFTYKSGHAEVFRRRKDWFEMPREAHLALWWVPRGHLPDTQEGQERLVRLREHGPSELAFTLKQRFEPAAAQSRNA